MTRTPIGTKQRAKGIKEFNRKHGTDLKVPKVK